MDKLLLDIPSRFETERLILRCYAPGDGPIYFAAGQKNRQHLQQFEADNIILTAQTVAKAEILVRELHADWTARNSFFMGAFDKKALEFVAQIYVGVVNWELPEFEIGYFVDIDHQGQGFVTEAVKATLGFIFLHLKAHRVRLHTRDTNLPSQRVAERCGFTLEGHIRESWRDLNGLMSGDFYYGLLKSEYNATC